MMWLLLMILMLAVVGLLFWYLVNRVSRLSFVQKLGKHKKRNQILLALLMLGCLVLILALSLGMMDMIVCMIHLGCIWGICDFVSFLYHKLARKPRQGYLVGYIAFLITALWMGFGWYCAHHVFETTYTLETTKTLPKERLRVIEISDAHMGAIFHANKWEDYIKKINEKNPDMILLVGDIFDDGTSFEDMLQTAKAFANFQSVYGTYFVFGNHDKGYGNYRGYGEAEIRAALEESGVIILQDETVVFDDLITLIGREDKSNHRKAVAEISVESDRSTYTIVMDHQPTEYDKYAAMKMDLVLSGHTHGGQFIPILKVGEWIGANDATYGLEKRMDTNFIVSSGIADWELKFKTGCVSEIVIIDIEKAR